MASPSTTVFDSRLDNEPPSQFTPPDTPSRLPYRDAGIRQFPTKLMRLPNGTLDYDEFQALLNSDITTAAEKELASRVVKAAEKLKEWCAEIEQWGWSGSFEAPLQTLGGSGPFDGGSQEQEFPGSLPLEQVEAYESRLDNIDDELTILEVDELKEQILGIHSGRSRPTSSYSSQSYATNITLYNDFQLFVTGALMATLPHHARLKQYLKAWSARLAVLAEIPSFLRGSYHFSTLLNGAYDLLQYPLGHLVEPDELGTMEKQLLAAKNQLEQKVRQLGRQLDRMLDILEETDDHLPDEWIDKFEADEKEYTDWSYEANKRLFQLRILESALKNDHDISAFLPPNLRPPALETTMVLGSVEPIILDHVSSDRDQEPDESAEVLSTDPVMAHSNSIKHNDIVPTELLASVGQATARVPIAELETVQSESTMSHMHSATSGSNEATATPELDEKNIEKGSDAFAEEPIVGQPSGIADSSDVETTTQYSKIGGITACSLSKATDHAKMFRHTGAATHVPSSVVELPMAVPKTSPPQTEIVASIPEREDAIVKSNSDLDTLRALETSALTVKQEPSAEAFQADAVRATSSIDVADLPPCIHHTVQLLQKPEDALWKLEGLLHTDDSAIELMDPASPQEVSPSASTNVSQPPVVSCDEDKGDDVKDGHGNIADIVASDLSFLERYLTEATSTHRLHPSSVRRASSTSIESFSRDKVKTVTLSRRNSANLSRRASSQSIASLNELSSSFPVHPGSTSMDGSKLKISFGPSSPASTLTQAQEEEPISTTLMTPSFQAKNQSATSLLSSVRSDASEERQPLEDSPLSRVRERTMAYAPKPPLNWAMRKRRSVDVDSVLDTSRSASSTFSDVETRPSPGASPSSVSNSPTSPKSPIVPFEEHLSSLLDTLPAPIRLKSGSSHDAPTITSKNQTASASQSYQPRSRASTPALSPQPTLTLAPAEESLHRRSGVNDPEIKVYNLISGKDKPIKLFVRRVGESGERIMVRVGGGWSDLGDYLRTYAEHHGRRTAIDGRIEVLSITPLDRDSSAIPSIGGGGTPGSRRTSFVSSIGSSAINGTTLPGSRSASRAGAVSPAIFDSPLKLTTPKLAGDEFLDTPQTTSSTSNGSRRTSNLWDNGNIGGTGLMGPAVAKKREQGLSEEKAKWVEGVVEQAKRTVGKTGGEKGMRRVFLKGKGPE